MTASAEAQISGSASLVSDYRYRGASLSDNEPAAQFGLAYDDATGWYAGLVVSTVDFGGRDGRELQGIVYAGHAWRTASGPSIDAGISYSRSSGSQSYSYPELYAGFAADNLSGRLYFSPRYFGFSANTVYAELNGVYVLDDRVRLFAHVGVLYSGGERLVDSFYRRPEYIVDGRAGVTVDFDHFSVRLSGVAVSSNGAYPIAGARRNGVVLGVSRSF